MKLTPARKRGLEVLARHHPKPVRRSNSTDSEAGYIYWQTVNWLVAGGFAYLDERSQAVKLSGRGLALAEEQL